MTSIGQSIEALCVEHGLDRDLIIDAMKGAVLAAARKQFKSQDKTGESIQVEWKKVRLKFRRKKKLSLR
jgi:NusA N-terminal domain